MPFPECYACPLFDKVDYQQGGSGCKAKECIRDAIDAIFLPPECYGCPLFDKADFLQGGLGCEVKECEGGLGYEVEECNRERNEGGNTD